MEEYLKETKMLNFNSAKISDLVREKGWLELDEFHKIKNIYEFVQNDILFGYNSTDIPSCNRRMDRVYKHSRSRNGKYYGWNKDSRTGSGGCTASVGKSDGINTERISL